MWNFEAKVFKMLVAACRGVYVPDLLNATVVSVYAVQMIKQVSVILPCSYGNTKSSIKKRFLGKLRLKKKCVCVKVMMMKGTSARVSAYQQGLKTDALNNF